MKRMRPLLPIAKASLPLLALLMLVQSPADAKSNRKVSHSYKKVWPASVRFLRIDEGLQISEKDSDTGYILFSITDDGKVFSGSLEVVRRKDYSDRDAVELILQIKDRPSYMELSILDRLLLKLRAELGHPKPPPAKKKVPDEPPASEKDSAKDPA